MNREDKIEFVKRLRLDMPHLSDDDVKEFMQELELAAALISSGLPGEFYIDKGKLAHKSRDFTFEELALFNDHLKRAREE